MSLNTVLRYGLLSQGGVVTPVLPTISWTLKTGVGAYNLTHIAYGNGVWIASADRGCAVQGYVRKSLDNGANWETTSTNSVSTSSVGYLPASGYWYHHNRCNEGSTNVWYSNSLLTNNTWTGKKLNGQYHYSTWEANNYRITGCYNNYYEYTTDGVNWTSRRLAAVNSVGVQNASYDSRNGYYYIKTGDGNKTYRMTSPDGTGQAEVAAITGAQWYTACGANEVLAFTYGSTSATGIKRDSTNGTGFTETVTTLPTYTAIAGIKYYDGMYIMTYTNTADYTKHVALSFDGVTWQESTVPSWNATPYSGNGNIACGLVGTTHYIMIVANNSTSVLIGTYAD